MKNLQNWKDKLDATSPQPSGKVWDQLQMDLSEDVFLKKLNTKIAQVSEEPSSKVWASIHLQLTPKVHPQGRGLLFTLMATAALWCIAIGVWWMQPETSPPPSFSSSNIPAPVSIPKINSDSIKSTNTQKHYVNYAKTELPVSKSIKKGLSNTESEITHNVEDSKPLAENNSSQIIHEELIQVEIPNEITQHAIEFNPSKDTSENRFAMDQDQFKIVNRSTPKIASIVNFVLTKVFKSSHTKLSIDSGVNSKNKPVWICQFESPLFGLKSYLPQKSINP